MIKLDEAKKLKLNDLIPEDEHSKIDKVTIENNFLMNCTEITVIYLNNAFKELEEIEGTNLDHIQVIKDIRKKFKEG